MFFLDILGRDFNGLQPNSLQFETRTIVHFQLWVKALLLFFTVQEGNDSGAPGGAADKRETSFCKLEGLQNRFRLILVLAALINPHGSEHTVQKPCVRVCVCVCLMLPGVAGQTSCRCLVDQQELLKFCQASCNPPVLLQQHLWEDHHQPSLLGHWFLYPVADGCRLIWRDTFSFMIRFLLRF